MAEPTQENPERVPKPEAIEPPLASEPEQRMEEDLLDLRENLQRDPRVTRHINIVLIGTYVLVFVALVAGAYALWQYTHRF